ncbi:MAG: Phosphoglycerate mutase [Frankiales bacterium]|nr:Phosphoglycerate mutase [Frankiales bacterium]
MVVTSDLVRASDTAQALGGAALVDPRLRELELGAWQGLTSEEARERFPDEHAAWRAGEDVPRGGGETYRQAGERAAACLLEHLPAQGTLLAVTHGGTARAALGVLLELPPASWARLVPLGNACWSVLVEGDVGWRLERHNASAGPLLGARDVGAAPMSPDVEPVR